MAKQEELFVMLFVSRSGYEHHDVKWVLTSDLLKDCCRILGDVPRCARGARSCCHGDDGELGADMFMADATSKPDCNGVRTREPRGTMKARTIKRSGYACPGP